MTIFEHVDVSSCGRTYRHPERRIVMRKDVSSCGTTPHVILNDVSSCGRTYRHAEGRIVMRNDPPRHPELDSGSR
ncbi:MAG: hypothetical protein SPJ03_08050 [Candidatus Cryptobacteroides sp.]|nr:hypothetical protein [Candidatus Cryptobacteroides sp.]